jgi:hypothetical protein
LNKKVTRVLHDKGIEMTPKEVQKTRKAAFAKIRTGMRKRGYQVPDGDLELWDWMKSIGL